MSCRSSDAVRLPFLLGIVGGMGPLAGVDFASKLIAETRASVDQEHLPFVLWSDPGIPDRTRALSGAGPSPLPRMLGAIRALSANDVSLIAIPCNTAHAWHSELVQAASCPVLHIVQSAMSALRECVPAGSTVGLLATAGTIATGMYQRALADEEFSFDLFVQEREQVDSAIDLVKSGHVAAARTVLSQILLRGRARNLAAVILACTELPLAAPDEDRSFVIDATRALARSCIQIWQRARRERGALETV